MAIHGDDCYFFYYSTCTKGNSCPFRHCEAAIGSETVCNLWQEGRCFRAICKFRHMEITKNRKGIPCYWENQPAGCQKPHCAFFHEKPRYIDGVFVPPDRSECLCKNDEQPQEEPTPPPAAPLPTTSNPQLRGVLKTETQEPVPSPTHPPVVINPTDDDEDEDDQFSEEGEDGKVGPSTRKLPKSDGSLNFGVSTLEEIRLRKALKASMKRAGYPAQSADTSASREKENIQSLFQSDLCGAREETERPRSSVAERLGRKVPNTDGKIEEGFPLKKSLSERLGRVVDEKEPPVSPQKASKPIKQRLGLLGAGPVASTQPAETNMGCRKSPEQIRIKTLEEIKQEKAAKSHSQNDGPSVMAPEITKTVTTKATKGVKRTITLRDSIGCVNMFSEVLHTKKKKQEEQNPSPKKVRPSVEKAPGKSQGESKTAGPGPEATNMAEVRVKTLEEIRREKAARMQPQQALEAESKNSSTEENGAKKPLLRLNKLASQTGNVTTEKSPEGIEMPVKTPTAALETSSASSNDVKVKTFEEIMRVKRFRKQEMNPTKEPATDATLPSDQKSSPEHTANTKVRPKLNVKPSVVKPAVRVKPGQKRKGAERSAVAEVKPLNSTSTVLEEPLQKIPHRDPQGLLSSCAEAQLSFAVPHSPMTLLEQGSSSSPLREELQTVPVLKQSPRQETKPAVSVAAPKVACTVPQSPPLKSPTQAPKTRRHSTGVSCTRSTAGATDSSSAVDDFEMLISEFTDDHLEEDMDPSIGEDDLLQELSEMINS
ncbi:zinc finger CCCH domain-containing protein 11A isoform X1 [Channa argus]|uniref:zinc finger CCCH domain-containing protein 11A isoform X1 n=1 Tax=Channa argus TaxID=215402 RepID=UPI0029454E9E|nr:hypothetical protein Q8A73_005174 [Channa argus]